MIKDLTLMYITSNRLSESWMNHHITLLKNVVGDTKIITVSKKPMNLGYNIVENPNQAPSYWGIYSAMLTAAKAANTEFVAQVEDDVLYSKEHFEQFRPKSNEVSYNRARWSLFAWEKNPIYCLRQRISNCSMIGPTQLVIDALQERINKWPNGEGLDFSKVGEIGRPNVEDYLGVSRRKMTEWYSTVPVIHINHGYATEDRQSRQWKQHGQIKAYDIPYWGRANLITEKFNNANNN